ncbi:Periplasmic zinc-binding protein TroA precursor [Symmachiella dynata]|nr:Periplasmic zinc-binding protein TroA precursor [Symmachiella dynata]
MSLHRNSTRALLNLRRTSTASRTAAFCTWSLILLLAGGLSGCSSNAKTEEAAGGKSAPKYKILATTLMIADAAARIAGEDVQVEWLMGPGVDPHLYQPTAKDRIKLQSADVILYQGLHLEGKMVDTFESIAKQGRTAVAVSRDIPDSELLSWEGGLHDPHVWHDPKLWKRCVQTMLEALIAQDPESASAYRERATAYLAELDELDAFCKQRVAEIPPAQRWLITSHDAFHYYGRAYGFQVVGIQGISTESEAGLKAITDAVDLIKTHKIGAIFPETSVPQAAINRVAQDSGAQLGPELYSDALGGVGSGADTYVGMIQANTNSVVDGLKTPSEK